MEIDARAHEQNSAAAQLALLAAVAMVIALGALLQPAAPERDRVRPARDEQVLARVPARSSREQRELEQLRARAALAPRELSRALALARGYIELARRDGDPRQLGAAEAALAGWTERADPPPEVRVLRATLLQARHEFDRALADLERALILAPEDPDAWLLRATVWTVKGGYAQARASCAALSRLVGPPIAAACNAPIDALTGHAAEAREQLERALAASSSPAERAWLQSLAGEQAFWTGDVERSERLLRAALALDPADRYTRGLYADLLLDLGRADEARALIAAAAGVGEQEKTAAPRDDALALRVALAELARTGRAGPVAQALERSFAASRLRGDTVHQREEARLWLARGEPRRALTLALESWAVQHEPWDARVVLEAALAAGQPERAAGVLAWLRTTHFEAPRLRALAERLEQPR